MDHKCAYFDVPRHEAVLWAIKFRTNVACMVGLQNVRSPSLVISNAKMDPYSLHGVTHHNSKS